jgi:hypothetical protein
MTVELDCGYVTRGASNSKLLAQCRNAPMTSLSMVGEVHMGGMPLFRRLFAQQGGVGS